MEEPIPCALCGRFPLREDPDREAFAQHLRRTAGDRLHRVESFLDGTNAEQRLEVAGYLGGLLERPPLNDPGVTYAASRALVEALWWDVADRTRDPLEPMHPHPRLDDHHPWKTDEA